MTIPLLSRIVLRYVAGYLVLNGLLDATLGAQVAADADVLNLVQLALGAVIAGATEFAYYLARRFGWAK